VEGFILRQIRLSEEKATYRAKDKLMSKLKHQLDFDPLTSFAFGDSESDLPLLQSVAYQNGYLVGESEKLAGSIVNRKWNIVNRDEKMFLNHVQSRLGQVFLLNDRTSSLYSTHSQH
jgi:histidinol phosphatase-like enzyme